MNIELPEHTRKYLLGIQGVETVGVEDGMINIEIHLENVWETKLPNDLHLVRETVEECFNRAVRKHAFHPMNVVITTDKQEFQFTIEEEWIEESANGESSWGDMQQKMFQQESIEDLPEYDSLSVDLPRRHHYDTQVAFQQLVEMGGFDDMVEIQEFRNRLKDKDWSDQRIDLTVDRLYDEDFIRNPRAQFDYIIIQSHLNPSDKSTD